MKDWLAVLLAAFAMLAVFAAFPLEGRTPWYHPRGFFLVAVLALLRMWR